MIIVRSYLSAVAALALSASHAAATEPEAAWQAFEKGAESVTRDAVNVVREPVETGWEAVVKMEPTLRSLPQRALRAPAPQPAVKPAKSFVGEAPPGGGRHALAGIASYYWQGTKTASGEPFNKRDMTAAHPTLPFGTRVKVHCKSTGRDVIVRINDRGPFKPGRVIDLSEAAAEVIGMQGRGLTPVQLTVLKR